MPGWNASAGRGGKVRARSTGDAGPVRIESPKVSRRTPSRTAVLPLFPCLPRQARPQPEVSPGPAPLSTAPDHEHEAALPRAVPKPPLPVAPPAGEALTSWDVDESAPGGSAERLAALHAAIAAGHVNLGASVPAQRDNALWSSRDGAAYWSLGAADVDTVLGPAGLAVGGVHEIKPMVSVAGGCHAGDWTAALAFLLRLARRRLMALAAPECGTAAAPMLLWCQPRHVAGEMGQLHAPGLSWVGIDPAQVILVETSRREDTLWAMEEGLVSGAVALVAGIVDDVALTPARRLALRTEHSRTPCLLLTSPRAPPTAATATRWRIARHRGALHPFDSRAPGALRLGVMLERCRQRPLLADAAALTLEWSDEAHRFHMASGVADRADGARVGGRRAA